MNMPHFEPCLPTTWHHTHLEETDSTMLQLKKQAYWHSVFDFELLTAGYQTAGRGQRGTHWEADRNDNLLFGFVFHPEGIAARQQFSLSEALALGVREALTDYTDGICVKWPNDVYWNNKKICGMLLEHTLEGWNIASTLTGVGINVNQQRFFSDAPNPVSLLQITGKETNIVKLLEKVVMAFSKRYETLKQGGFAIIHEEYMRHLYRKDGFFTYEDGSGRFEAAIKDISPEGMLTLCRRNGREHTYAFKEVRFAIDGNENN